MCDHFVRTEIQEFKFGRPHLSQHIQFLLAFRFSVCAPSKPHVMYKSARDNKLASSGARHGYGSGRTTGGQ